MTSRWLSSGLYSFIWNALPWFRGNPWKKYLSSQSVMSRFFPGMDLCAKPTFRSFLRPINWQVFIINGWETFGEMNRIICPFLHPSICLPWIVEIKRRIGRGRRLHIQFRRKIASKETSFIRPSWNWQLWLLEIWHLSMRITELNWSRINYHMQKVKIYLIFSLISN